VTSSIRAAATAASSWSTRWAASARRAGACCSTSRRRGIGLLNKLRAYELQENGLDTVEANLELGFAADAREYGIGSQILSDLGLTTIRVLTNNPKKISGIAGFGLTVVSQEPIEIEANHHNRAYLEAKREKMGHTIGTKLHHQRVRWDPEDHLGAWV
jgi:3,4-dihydroxy 2-butanone 4-phosphate synthase/GTP cyclohydrolase II